MISSEKLQRLESLTKREFDVLGRIMANPKVKISDLIDPKNGPAESTVRNILSNIYIKLDIPGELRQKRENLISEYASEYRELYLQRLGLKPTPNATKPPVESTPQPTPTPQIHITPPEGRQNTNRVLLVVFAGFLLVAVIVIGLLVGVLRGLI